MCSCRMGSRSSTPTSTRSTRRSPSGTTRRCAGARCSSARGSSWRRATRRAPTASAAGWATAQARRAVPGRDRGRVRLAGLRRGEPGGVRDLRAPAPVVEPGSMEEAFLDVRGAATPARRSPRALRREVREEVGLPLSVGVARTKVLAKIASRSAKPDGLFVVPAGARARVPARAAGRAALGRRAGDGAQAPCGRAAHRRPGAALGEAELMAILGKAAGRYVHAIAAQPRPPAGAPAARPAVVRRAAGARPRAAVAGGPRRGTGRPRRADDAAHAAQGPRRAHGRPAPALRRLLPRDALVHPGRARPPAGAVAAARAELLDGGDAARRAARDHARRPHRDEPRRARAPGGSWSCRYEPYRSSSEIDQRAAVVAPAEMVLVDERAVEAVTRRRAHVGRRPRPPSMLERAPREDGEPPLKAGLVHLGCDGAEVDARPVPIGTWESKMTMPTSGRRRGCANAWRPGPRPRRARGTLRGRTRPATPTDAVGVRGAPA